jgi:hypothetical protein
MMRSRNWLGCAIALATLVLLTTLLSLTGAPAWARGRSDVVPCDLSGVNPAYHPAIFGNPEVARKQYGFVQERDGKWRVKKPCNIRT